MTVHITKATRAVSGFNHNIMRQLSKGELIEWVENTISDGEEVEVRDGDKVVFKMARYGCFITRTAG